MWDVDGNVFVDVFLGDAGAMTGHAPAPAAGRRQRAARARDHGDAAHSECRSGRGGDGRRFGLRDWRFTVSATGANRFVVRIGRQVTGRPKILIFNHCYHGSVDETVAKMGGRGGSPRDGSVGPPVRSSRRRGSSSSTTSRGWSVSSSTGMSPAC